MANELRFVPSLSVPDFRNYWGWPLEGAVVSEKASGSLKSGSQNIRVSLMKNQWRRVTKVGVIFVIRKSGLQLQIFLQDFLLLHRHGFSDFSVHCSPLAALSRFCGYSQ